MTTAVIAVLAVVLGAIGFWAFGHAVDQYHREQDKYKQCVVAWSQDHKTLCLRDGDLKVVVVP